MFDTRDCVKPRENAGIPATQAEAHARSLAQAMHNTLVKKACLDHLRADMRECRTDVNGQFTRLK